MGGQVDPATGPRPLAVGPSAVLKRTGGRDVAPRGASSKGTRAVPVGLHAAGSERQGPTVEQGWA